MTADYDYDLFISHASEDKDPFVRELVAELEGNHLSVWYDEFALVPGDSLTAAISKGLARSRFGVVILSEAFFEKQWPQAELGALTSREMSTGERVLLPVWLGVDREVVAQHSPLLADKSAIPVRNGAASVADRIRDVVRPGKSPIKDARELLADFGVASPPPLTRGGST